MITYTQWLNDARQARGRPHGHQARRRALLGGRLRHRAPPRRDVDAAAHRRPTRTPSSPTSRRATRRLNVQGPRSRELLQSLTSRRPVQRGLPVPHGARDRHRLRARAVRAHHLPRRARLRALHPGRAGARTSTTAWSRPASAFGLRHAGLKALASLRMEKGYRDYGHDIDNTDTVLEAGLGFAVDLKKPGGFIGQASGAGEEGRRPAHAAPGPGAGAATRSRCCSTPRSCAATASRVGYVRAGVVRPHARRRGRPGDDRGRRADRPGVPRRRRSGRSRSRASAIRRWSRCRPLYDPKMERIKI